MRALLRRRVNEATANLWTDPDLNDLLDIGLQQVQQYVQAVDPDAFLFRSRIDLVADQALYQLPDNCQGLRAVKKKDPVSGLYERLRPTTYERAQDRSEQETDDSDGEFARFGKFLWILPAPSANQSAGLELDFVPVLSLGADTDVPPIPISLHYAVVLRAEIAAKGETSDGADVALAEFASLMGTIPSWYRPSIAGGAPDSIQVDLGKQAY